MNVTLVVGVLCATAATAFIAYRVVLVVIAHRLDQAGRLAGRSAVKRLREPAMWSVLFGALEIALVSLTLPRTLNDVLVHVVGTALVVSLAWLAVKATYVVDDVVIARHPMDAADNIRARQLKTQVNLFRRVFVVIISIVALAFVLLSFPAVRAEGEGLLASAGLVGLVAGIAAQPLFSNLVAGVQIAITQPVRVDDVVVIDGHWGRVEDIHLTYAVVRIWDLRRLIVPISYLTTQLFENWTRSAADILGWVHIEVDYSAPVEAIRQRFNEICASSPDWDGKVAVLQVTNLGLTMQLRALMSSPDSSRSWSLQCDVREKLIDFLQRDHPGALPRLRTEVTGEQAQGRAAPGPGQRAQSGPVPGVEP